MKYAILYMCLFVCVFWFAHEFLSLIEKMLVSLLAENSSLYGRDVLQVSAWLRPRRWIKHHRRWVNKYARWFFLIIFISLYIKLKKICLKVFSMKNSEFCDIFVIYCTVKMNQTLYIKASYSIFWKLIISPFKHMCLAVNSTLKVLTSRGMQG